MSPVSRRRFLTTTLGALALAGCDKKQGAGGNPNKVRIGYIGITCEAPLFVAVENGYFKEEGLEVEMVKCEWAMYKDALALGSFDVTHHLIMMFLKPIEQGLDVKMTAGIHRGCLRVQAPKDGKIKTVADLRGKRIAVPGMGTPPFIFANRVLGANGIDASKEIEWRVFSNGELGLALEKGEVDAIANSEPIGTLLLADGKVQNVADQAKDLPYSEEYCCAVIVNGKYLTNNPKATAASTRAILKGAKWVETNPRLAARLSVEKKYLGSNPELNTTAISNLRYIPSISGGRAAVISASEEMKKAGMLNPNTDVAALANKAFAHLEGIDDAWIEKLQVEKLAAGQVPPDQALRLAAELLIERPDGIATCCAPAKNKK